MAHAGDEAASRRLIGGVSGAKPCGFERSPIGFERFRHHGRVLVVRAEHPHGAVGRQGIELFVGDDLDTLLAPGLGETRIDGRARRAHHDQPLLGAERLRQRRRDFERAQPAIDLKLRIDLDALRGPFQVEADVDARPVGRHRNGSGLDALVGRDDDGNIEREQTPALHLGEREIDVRAAAGGAVELEFRRSDALDPLIEERPQVEARHRLKAVADVVEGRLAKPVVAVERLQALDELRVAELLAQHVEDHGGPPVADGFGDGVMAAHEARQREVVLRRDVVRDPLQDGAAMVGTLAALLGDEMVGEVGGQPLAPVAAREVDEDAVAPPVVQQFMRIRSVQDERKPDDLLAQQREGRHAVAGLPKILHQGELGIRIGPKEAAIHLEVLRRGVEVTVRQRLVGLAQERHGLHGAGVLGIFGEWRGDQVHLFGRRRDRPAVPNAGRCT